jgi:hypothetical protein
LVPVEDVGKTVLFGDLIVAGKLDCREGELRLLHIVVYGFVEILAHVSLENHREVVTEPFTLVAALNWL